MKRTQQAFVSYFHRLVNMADIVLPEVGYESP